MKEIILIGRGGHALSCLDVIRSLATFKVIGYVDAPGSVGGVWEGIPFLGTDDDLPKLIKKSSLVVLGLGHVKSSDLRRSLVKKLKELGADFPTVVSPRAYVSPTAHIGMGTIVMHDAYVGPNAFVGEFNILNTKSLIEHGARIGDFVHVATAAVVNGDVKVSNDVFLGSSSVTCQGIEIPNKAFVQAGQFIGRKHVW